MITPIHIIFNLGVFSLIDKIGIANVSTIDLMLLLSSELMDLDHLLSKPIYHPRRDPFKTHILHKNWKIIVPISILFLFYRPLLFLGIGLLSHVLLDYIYVKMYNIKNISTNT